MSLDASLGHTPSKHVPTKVHKGTLIKEKGTPNKEKTHHKETRVSKPMRR